jgi:hypothetical protein
MKPASRQISIASRCEMTYLRTPTVHPPTGRRLVVKVVGFRPVGRSYANELQSNLAAGDGCDSGTARCRDKHQLSRSIHLSVGWHTCRAFVLSCQPRSLPLLGTRQERQRPVVDNHTIDYWFILNLSGVQLPKWFLLFFLLPARKQRCIVCSSKLVARLLSILSGY